MRCPHLVNNSVMDTAGETSGPGYPGPADWNRSQLSYRIGCDLQTYKLRHLHRNGNNLSRSKSRQYHITASQKQQCRIVTMYILCSVHVITGGYAYAAVH
jgi:hypothetical protein